MSKVLFPLLLATCAASTTNWGLGTMICETDEKMKDGAGGTGTGPGSGNPPSGGPGTGSGNGPPSGSSGSSGSAGAGRRLGKVDDCWEECEAWLDADEALAGEALVAARYEPSSESCFCSTACACTKDGTASVVMTVDAFESLPPPCAAGAPPEDQGERPTRAPTAPGDRAPYAPTAAPTTARPTTAPTTRAPTTAPTRAPASAAPSAAPSPPPTAAPAAPLLDADDDGPDGASVASIAVASAAAVAAVAAACCVAARCCACRAKGAGADVEDEPKDPDDYATNNAISLHPTLP
jgi:hypothetical protein